MQRWAAGVEYLGTGYGGWQAQPATPSIQGELEAALSTVADGMVKTVAAGRTDAGVHAFGQVVHFDSAAARRPYAWLLGTNSRLPRGISLSWVQPVAGDFDARRSAVARRYRYVIHNRRARSALLAERAAWIARALDAEAMHRGAQCLLGEHDYSAFRAAGCQSRSVHRNVHEVAVWRRQDFVVLDIRANAFLHHMVRNILGTLLEIGHGVRPVAWAGEVLASRDRRQAGMTAPAEGLYFVGPDYPARHEMPAPALAWFP